MSRAVIKAGALCYVAWGALHIWVSWSIWRLGSTQAAGFPQARLHQDALFMLFFAVGAAAAALIFLWRERVAGYWINLILVSYADIFWIVLFILPGLAGGIRGWAGPVLWLLGLFLTSVGFAIRGVGNLRRRRAN